MKPKEFVELIKQDDSKLLENIPDQQLLRIIRAIFTQVGKQIDAADEGVVRVPGFGTFQARQIEREKDGKKVTVKRINFRRSRAVAGEKRRAAK